jgi:putative transposase
MARKHHKPEEIVAKLRQVEVMTGQGKPVAEALKERQRGSATRYPSR